jgi:thiol-disulfide isomerase/thioredoxin
MKRIFLFLTLLLLTFSAVFSQNNKKLVVMVTRANWCPPCRANEAKINNELIPAYSTSKDVIVVTNDITNKKSKAKSKPVLQSAGVYEISLKEQATGSIAIINLANGKIVNRLHVVYDTERIKKAIADALAGI